MEGFFGQLLGGYIIEICPIVLPMPVASPASNNQNTNVNAMPILLTIELNQILDANNHFYFNITQGKTIEINVNLTSVSTNTGFTTPLYLSIGAFNNQPSPKIITSALSPYPVLPCLHMRIPQTQQNRSKQALTQTL
jgi:hypothetical protein